jgi:hypothetical protein
MNVTLILTTMKRLIILIIISLSLVINAKTQDTAKKEPAKINNKEQNEINQKSAANSSQNLTKKSDTTRIKLGNKAISIIDVGKGTSVKVEDLDENKSSKDVDEGIEPDNNKNENKNQKHTRFKGHWSGFEFGMNNFMNKNFSMTRSVANNDEYMDINTGRSWNVNLNLFQHSFGFGTDIFGLVTGLGFEFNDYHFDGNNNIQKDANGNTVILDYSLRVPAINLEKSKISTGYLTLPLMLELQFPGSAKNSKRIHIAAGVIGGLKMGSHSKVEYYVNGKLQKDIVKDDFNIRSLRYAYTARVGYGNLTVFANYYATSFFEKDKGPELYPFAIGLSLNL